MTATDVVPPSAVEPEKPNTFQRIIGVLFSPGETFDSIVKRPNIVGPLLIFAMIWIAGASIAVMKIDFHAVAREAVEMNPNVPADRVDSMVGMNAAIMKGSAYAGPIIYALALILTAGILLFAFRMFAGEGDFRTAFSVTIYAWVPRLIRGILGMIVMATKSSFSFFELQNPVMSNPGFLFDPKAQPLLYAIAADIDVFNIWTVVLLILGFSTMSRLPRGRSTAIVLTLWIALNLVLLIFPAIQAAKAHQ